MRIAIIADIHSNSLALEAVLEEVRRDRVDQIVQLGDAFNGPIDPGATLRMLRECGAVHVRGNGDRMVSDLACPNPSRSSLFARARLSSDDLAFVASWPASCRGEGWLACHGSPRSDTEYLLEDVAAGGVSIRSSEQILGILGEDCASLILCGHTHVPRVVRLPTGTVVVNPGSVGLPAYYEEGPIPHKMETGSPHARYAVVEGEAGRWAVSLKAVPYDWEEAALAAIRNGFADWASSLRTGYA